MHGAPYSGLARLIFRIRRRISPGIRGTSRPVSRASSPRRKRMTLWSTPWRAISTPMTSGAVGSSTSAAWSPASSDCRCSDRGRLIQELSSHSLGLRRCCTSLLPVIERYQKPIPQFDACFDALARRPKHLQPASRIIGSRGGENGFCRRTVLVTVHSIWRLIVYEHWGPIRANAPLFQQIAEHARDDILPAIKETGHNLERRR